MGAAAPPGAQEAEAFGPVGPPPQPPRLTGNPAKDAAAEAAFQRELDVYGGKLTAAQIAVNQGKAGANTYGANEQLKLAREGLSRSQKEYADYRKIHDEREATINAREAEERKANEDLTKGYWADKSTGNKVVAALSIALGGFGQGLQNAGAAYIGQVGQAKNQGMEALDKLMAQDYRAKQAKVAGAKDAVLQARYGYQRAEDNHRAALNEIDADQSAKWKVVAADVHARLAKLGMSEAEIQGNQLYVAALEKSSQHREAIHEREIDRAEKEREARAREATAAYKARHPGPSPFDKMQAALDKEQRSRNVKSVSDFNTLWRRDHAPQSQFGKVTDMNVKLGEGLKKAKSTNPEAQNFALQDIARIVKGGTLTEYASTKDTAALGGTVDQIQAWANKNQGKGLPPEMQKRLVEVYNEAIDGTVDTLGSIKQGDVDAYMGEGTGYYGLKRHVEGAMDKSYAPIRNSRGENPFKVAHDPYAPAIDLVTGEQITPERPPPKPAALPGPGREALEKPKGDKAAAPPTPKGPSQDQINTALDYLGHPEKFEAIKDPTQRELARKNVNRILTDANML
jgi:hypothetical protein